MTNPISTTVAQRDLVGAVATIGRARGWAVVELHGSHQNPAGASLPDLMLTKAGRDPVMAKVFGKKGELSRPQQAWFDHFTEVGFRCVTYHPDDFDSILEALT